LAPTSAALDGAAERACGLPVHDDGGLSGFAYCGRWIFDPFVSIPIFWSIDRFSSITGRSLHSTQASGLCNSGRSR
jgi:hypothetical protein